jgi:hypothetical protein
MEADDECVNAGTGRTAPAATGRARYVHRRRTRRPARAGQAPPHPFGGEITGYATFDGLTIPSAGRVGWFFGTDRWPASEFFRYQITDLHLVGAADR